MPFAIPSRILKCNERKGAHLRLAPVFVAALLLAACATTGDGSRGTLDTIKDAVGNATTPVMTVATSVIRTTIAGADPANASALKLLPADVPPKPTRSPQALFLLMKKGRVSGNELLDEMKTMRLAVQKERSATAIAAFNGSVEKFNNAPAAAKTSAAVGGMVANAALEAVMSMLKEQALSVSYQALDQHMALLIDDPRALQQQFVMLPDPSKMNVVQQQRAVTIAAILVMTRATNRILENARKDFVGVEAEYLQLLDRREKAAALLYQALASAGSDAVALPGLSPRDVDFLRNGLARMPMTEFAHDLGAQNLALAYLERTNPGAFGEYKVQSQEVLGRARGVLRLTSGAVAFSAMLAIFSQQMGAVMRGKSTDEITALVPMGLDFMREVPALLRVAMDAGAEGAKLPFTANRRFRVGDAGVGAAGVEIGSSRDVFGELRRRQADGLLRDALFRNGASGLLHKLYLCSPPEAGRMLDTALPVSDREDFAKTYFQQETPRFSFANSFENGATQASREQRALDDQLLRSDQRERTQETTQAMSAVQKKVADGGGYERWGDEQLLRLIFSNREGTAQYATLQLGETVVRPIANSQSVFAYESLVDLCRNLVQPAAPPSRVTAPAPARAITTPTPTPPSTPPRRPAAASAPATRK